MSEEKNFFEQNVEMWERMTSSYMDSMFKTVEKTMEQSKTFKDQVDQAVTSAVNMPMDAAMTTLQALQRQVEALSEKVDKLMEQE